jgi:hypothetical protein
MSELDRLSAWSPDRAPKPEEIFNPLEHRNALDIDRTVVVGNRGVGKTFWSQALVDTAARQHVAEFYPRLGLERVEARLGFSGAYAENLTASERTITQAEQCGIDIVRVWEAVLLRFLADKVGFAEGKGDLKDVAKWLQNNAERGEQVLRQVDLAMANENKRFLLIFDGLDALGNSWEVIRGRIAGLIRFARLAKSFRAIRIKIFMRLDQAEDRLIWQSPDASKLFNERVRLRWEQDALYALLFFHLRRQDNVREAIHRIVSGSRTARSTYKMFTGSHETQRSEFTALAGPSMGGGTNRGNTYNWVVNHLADAHGETTPRAFLVALAQAAAHPTRASTVIDHLGIQAGVREASERRLRELEEDYWWIRTAFEPLADTRVPCEPQEFIDRWLLDRTAYKITESAESAEKEGVLRLPPIAFDSNPSVSKESALLSSLKLIGVVEERSNGKINMPDIFRVAAGIKRLGGVKPPPRKGMA